MSKSRWFAASCDTRRMRASPASATATFGMSFMGSILRSWRRAQGADETAPVTRLFLDIEDNVHGARMGWGPEIADLHQRLARLVASVDRSTCCGVQLRGTAFRMTFETRRPRALQAALVRAVEAEAVAPFAQILVCGHGDPSAEQRVWP